ncbi:transmembrane/endomembrane-like protein [Leptomonas seymouri]|uniref:Transmembrane 9 superfamily member n=1 Tax=Leptomonas seymouri TaxID=5684 RepID=A0A0N1I6Y7_LEPSE|nr:transmembrane/endomembrane-like protein [Leptomonas seymouri]|eukprot:KPI88002.1 transmembrane/endomembrane-like protein [Leptomonas seymouri]
MNARAVLVVALTALLYAAYVASAASPIFVNYKKGDVISPRANAYRSRRTLMPFNYYSIPMCKPPNEKMEQDKVSAGIGEILMGNRLVPTLFEFKVAVDEECKQLCVANFMRKDLIRARQLIDNLYDVRMFLDHWPLVSSRLVNDGTVTYRKGYPIGISPKTLSPQRKIYNHLDFTIRYRADVLGGYILLGFHVTPQSYANISTCNSSTLLVTENVTMKFALPFADEVNIPFTYSVKWEESSSSYLIAHSAQEVMQKRGHKIAAMYGVLITVLVGIVVAFVMLRTVRKDLAIYFDEELDESEMREGSGWKLVRGDVFRPPPQAILLSTLVGAGSQISATMLVTMLLCSTGAVNPDIRGNFLTAILTVFLFLHIVSGFVTSRLLKLFGMDSWKVAMQCMATFPLALGGGILTINFIHWINHTTAAIPFGTIVLIALMWVVVSLPFGAAGVFCGYRMDRIAVAAKVSSIPRLIPAEAGSKTIYYAILGSVVPFVACCVEVSYVLNAFWREEQMYMFGLLTFFLLTVMALCAEVGIIVTYFTLCDEDYRWWWRSFGALAATGAYVFCFSIFFLKRSLEIRLLGSIILFLAYMLGVSVMFGLALGTISFIGSFWLVQGMYGAIKAD